MKHAATLLLISVLLLSSLTGCQNSDQQELTQNSTTTSSADEITSLPTPSPAEDFLTKDNGDGTLLACYRGDDADVVFPAEIGGKPITVIGTPTYDLHYAGAVAEAAGLRSVILPESVVEISDGAFSGCVNLAQVTLPSSLQKIGSKSFYGCTSLRQIDIPACEIASAAFAYSGLERVTLAEGITEISSEMLAATALREITLPSTVKAIEPWAFSLCEQLTSITLNEGLERIAWGAFGYTPITELTMPASVTDITHSTFSQCMSLTKVTFLGDAPADYLHEYDAAFAPSFTVYCIADSEGFTTPYWNGHLTQILSQAPTWKTQNGLAYTEQDGKIVILKHVDTQSVLTVPAEIDGMPVTEIAMYAFFNDKALISITLPDTLRTIGERAFSRSALTEITLPNSVTSLGSFAFFDCRALTSVTLPGRLEEIRDGTFRYCTALQTISIPPSVKSIGNEAFFSAGLTSVTLEDNLQTIGEGAFEGTFLTSIAIPTGVTEIAEAAFCGVPLKKLILHDQVTQIGDYAFTATKLTAVDIPAGVKAIGSHAFSGGSIQSVTLHEGLISIGEEAFSDAISEIIIPSTVTELSPHAFRNFKKGSAVKFEGNAPTLVGEGTFAQHSHRYTVYYHEGARGFDSGDWPILHPTVW